MAANVQGADGGMTTGRAEVRWLQRALVDRLQSAAGDGEEFLLNLIGGALGGLARARVLDPDSLLSDNAPLTEEQKVAVLLCKAVYLFDRSCARGSPSQDPLAATIRNKARGEDLAKIVIDSGLNYLVNGSRSFSGLLNLHTPYQYFDSKLKKALETAQIKHGGIEAEVATVWTQNDNGARA